MLTLVTPRCEQHKQARVYQPIGMLFGNWYPLVSKSLFQERAM